MLQYFQPAIDYIHQHPNIGTLIAFLIALAESLPLIGTVIPGSITMTAIGTLIGTGMLPGFSTLAWASFGALIGDTIGFGCGSLFTEKIRHTWPFKKYPHWLELSEKFFAKHGGKSIIFGRFVGPARSTVPLVAGLLKMGWVRFIFAAIPSAIMWAILYMVPGILIGALAVELPPHIATEFLLVGILVIVLLWLVFWAIQYFFAQLAHTINVLIDRFWDALIRHKPSRPFIRLIAVKGRPADHYQLTLSILCLLAALLFFCIFYSVMHNTWLTGINQPLFHLMQSLHTKHIDQFFIVITLLGTPTSIAIVGGLACLGLAATRQWRAAIHLLAADILMIGAITFFKTIYYNARPEGFQIVKNTSSFPSGHTGMSFIIFSMLAYFSGKIVKSDFKWIPYTLASLSILLIAISRLYLGAHWFTDILGSITLGFTILFAVIVNYRRRAFQLFKTINKPYWWLVVIFSIALPWAAWTYKNYYHAVYRYTPIYPTNQTTIEAWWNNPTRHLPLYRLNRFNTPIQPFNLQWLGHLSKIQNTLKKLGWIAVNTQFSIKDTLERFLDKQKYHLPIFPWLYQHKPPRLIVIKNTKDGKRIIELRLWPSVTTLKNQHQPLWIGTINFYIPPPKKITFSRFKDVSLQESGGIKQLLSDLKLRNIYQYKLIRISKIQQPKKVRILNWDGHVIIIRKKHRAS